VNEPWTPALGREARNEQRKLRAGVANALAAAVAAVAILGDLLNPAVADQLSNVIRLGMALLAWLLHLLATWFVRDMEDR
jgi:hypothetical protein